MTIKSHGKAKLGIDFGPFSQEIEGSRAPLALKFLWPCLIDTFGGTDRLMAFNLGTDI